MSAAAFSHGPLRRSKPLLAFTQGYHPMSSHHRTVDYPPQTGVVIRSGKIVSPVYNSVTSRWELTLGLKAGCEPYIAMNDSDDFDVLGSGGVIHAISLSDAIQFQTGWVTVADATAWDAGAVVSGYAFDDGTAANRGNFKIAASGERILGVLAEPHQNGLIDVAFTNYDVTRDGDGKVLVAEIRAAYVPGNLLA